MLSPEQKAEAERKLKEMNEELANEKQLKSTATESKKIITDAINSMKGDPKKQLQILRRLGNQELPTRIGLLERTTTALTDTQERMKNEREKLNREALNMIEDKVKYEAGIKEIKRTIENIQKTVAESVQDEVKKRADIENNLEKSLQEIRGKIKEFNAETENFTKENAQLQQKIDALKAKLNGIQDSYKVKAEEKDQEVKGEKEQLNEKLKELEAQVDITTKLSKEYTALEKKNFDNKIAVYLKTKKFPEFASSFENSADTLNSCKQELLKGVQRMNTAAETVEKCTVEVEEANNQYLLELRRQKEKEGRIEELKKQKQAVRNSIIQLQNRLKEKKAA